MRRCKNLDFLLKISNYLKACSANYFSPEHGVPHSWSPPRTPFGGCRRSVERQFAVQSLSRVWLCKSMDCNTTGFPVLHHLLELAQTHVHWVGDAIQPSYPLSSPSPHAFYLSQHQGLFKWVSSSYPRGQSIGASASVLPMNIQDWFSLGWTGCISLQSKGLSRVFSNTTVQKHQFFMLSFLYGPTLTSIHDYWKNHSLDYTDICQQSNVSAF